MLSKVPTEILIKIIRALDRDVPTLKNAALVCRGLLPVVHEELFTAVNMHVLDGRRESPHHGLFKELFLRGDPRDTVTPITTGYRFCQAAAQPDHFPKLKYLHLVDLPVLFYQYLRPKFFHALASSVSITGLAIANSVFIDLRHVQSFVCALPNLRRLAICNVAYVYYHNTPTSMPAFNDAHFNRHLSSVAPLRPRLSQLIMSPSRTSTRAPAEIAQWLGLGPSAGSVTTLTVPYLSRGPHIVLRHFGPEVEVLSMPLRDLESGNVDHEYLSRYTKLRSLTVFLDSYDTSEGQWYLLAPFLERGIPGGEALRTVTIEVRIRTPLELYSAIDWAVLQRVNDALDESKFDALEKVVFAVQWKDTPNCKDASEVVHEVKRQIAQSLYDLVDSGKLETRVHAVEKVSACIIL
ncbi:hypothetical protein C8Q79DRAFT_921686 [Trametes meyenii]|nr:hypothetical protein C8Q79DRAFT_921686 [Trametes meyenii]